ncbi:MULTISPECIES: heavy-metal-associated domain-containing protein [Anaerolinea]|uniref:Heavy metal binding protein n=1 Tax=Anaerolinea thermophila (strain DSM 14523 / JCM 11388 / NBRC 100420 / UNI-1) TaxID=926569 RepID=E8N0F9_ANATU|nr:MULTISPECIES: heavy-metal-associated domain-containing protein [Anaerolinea]BAJ64708.1 heavy metal binding protein [Anaerolinea thermophila UNI-1]
MAKQRFSVPDMHCSACVMRLESLEDELPGVKQVKASYHKQEMEVEYDESKLTLEDLLEAVQKKGYHPQPME